MKLLFSVFGQHSPVICCYHLLIQIGAYTAVANICLTWFSTIGVGPCGALKIAVEASRSGKAWKSVDPTELRYLTWVGRSLQLDQGAVLYSVPDARSAPLHRRVHHQCCEAPREQRRSLSFSDSREQRPSLQI